MALITTLLIWSGWRVLEHERLLSRQRQEQVLAGIADRITSGILRDLSRFESEMDSLLRAEVDQRAAELKLIGEALAEDPQQDAIFLYGELHQGAWKVDRATYQFYRQQLGELAGGGIGSLDPLPVILAETTEVLWSEWQISRERGGTLPKVKIVQVKDFSLLNVAVGMGDIGLCLIAGREHLERWLIDPMIPILEEFDLSLRLTDSQGNLAAGDARDNWILEFVATPTETGLPWVFSLGAIDPASLGDDYSSRRTTLVIGLVVVLAAVVVIMFYASSTWTDLIRGSCITKLRLNGLGRTTGLLTGNRSISCATTELSFAVISKLEWKKSSIKESIGPKV